MLLTLKQPTNHGYKSFHDYTPPTPPSTSRFSPVVTSKGPHFAAIAITNKSLPPLPTTTSTAQVMSTPHRGLPPPAAMTLPQPTQQPPAIGPPQLSQPMGQLPAPPQQWQGAEESMRNWLHAKAEEDKRKQEEEKTRQESLRLEQRKIEQDMLRTSLTGGIPPYMIPLVFAGMGGGNLPNASLEWAQHYMAQAHHLQQQQQIQQQQQLLPSQGHVSSPEDLQRRNSRVISQPYGSTPQHQMPVTLPSTPIGPPSSQQSVGYLPGYPMSPTSRSRQIAQGQSSILRPQQTSHLPRLNTGEIHGQTPPAGLGMQIVQGQPGHPLQQSHTAQQQESQASPSIYFHHWQPPTSQAGTSSGNQPTSPSDQTLSPKKRKATGPQHAPPPPTSQPQYTSPPFSQTGSSVSNTPSGRRRGHSRHRSDISARGMDAYGRPRSRHRHSEGPFSAQSVLSPREASIPEQGPISAVSEQPRRQSGGSHPLSSLLEKNDSRQQSQPAAREPQYSAGPEMRHEERHTTADVDDSRRPNNIKRDDGRA